MYKPFTVKEIKNIENAMTHFKPYAKCTPEREAFFNKANLWATINMIISEVYIEKLTTGQLFLKDDNKHLYTVLEKPSDGYEYILVKKEEEKNTKKRKVA
jgi:hypothetical protein